MYIRDMLLPLLLPLLLCRVKDIDLDRSASFGTSSEVRYTYRYTCTGCHTQQPGQQELSVCMRLVTGLMGTSEGVWCSSRSHMVVDSDRRSDIRNKLCAELDSVS